ncbi:MAG: hypothetical protein OXC68_13780 [Aestuariivita sp.]|nr:hypothetical protein [Aestuariivita sp.]
MLFILHDTHAVQAASERGLVAPLPLADLGKAFIGAVEITAATDLSGLNSRHIDPNSACGLNASFLASRTS